MSSQHSMVRRPAELRRLGSLPEQGGISEDEAIAELRKHYNVTHLGARGMLRHWRTDGVDIQRRT